MKSTLLKSLFFIILVFLACDKEPLTIEERLEGIWELSSIHSDIFQNSTGKQVFPAGNGNIYSFKDNNYVLWRNGKIVEHGNFSIGLSSRTFGFEKIEFVLNKNSKIYGSDKVNFNVSGSKLITYHGEKGADGHYAVYFRL
jgi:hypothetical protein